MNRRGFLTSILAAAAAPAVVRAASLMPIALPSFAETVRYGGYNSFLTIDMITKEALRLLQANMTFMTINREFDESFGEYCENIKIVIRRPSL